MKDEKDSAGYDHHEKMRMKTNPTSSAVYGLGFLGAIVYFIIHATSFWAVVMGILKALIWPAVIVYSLLEFLNM